MPWHTHKTHSIKSSNEKKIKWKLLWFHEKFNVIAICSLITFWLDYMIFMLTKLFSFRPILFAWYTFSFVFFFFKKIRDSHIHWSVIDIKASEMDTCFIIEHFVPNWNSLFRSGFLMLFLFGFVFLYFFFVYSFILPEFLPSNNKNWTKTKNASQFSAYNEMDHTQKQIVNIIH